MSNLSLTRIENNGLELLIDQKTGECFASMSATAKMANCEVTQIRRLTGDTESLKTAWVKTSNGDKQAKLLNEEQIFDCLAKYNPELLAQCAKAGLRVYLHRLAGYEIKPQIPQTFAEALQLAADQAKQIEAQAKQIEAAKPALDFVEAIAVSETSIEFNAFAKLIGTGRTRLFKLMREDGIIMMNSNLPYQRWIDAGYFEVGEVCGARGVEVYALVTGKGQLWLQQRLKVKSGSLSTLPLFGSES
jgi:phage antirepressor YoqD-like protein